MNTPLISIIVPVYNVQKHLRRCLDSIIQQTYENFECILINDGSTDGSGEICDEIAKQDKRFIVIHQQNAGLSVARNNALLMAKGDYVSFVDSDDYILPQYLNSLLNAIISTDSDISKCDYFRGKLTNDKDTYDVSVVNSKKFTREVLLDKVGSQLWQYMYKKSLWNDIVSPAGRYAQDMMILHKITNRAKKIAVIDQKLYFYYIDRNDSTSNDSKKKVKGAFDRAIAFKNRYLFAKEFGYEDCCNKLIKNVMDFYNNALTLKKHTNDLYLDDMKDLSSFLKQELKFQQQNKEIGFKYILLGYLLGYSPNMYCRLKGKSE